MNTTFFLILLQNKGSSNSEEPLQTVVKIYTVTFGAALRIS